MSGPRDYAALAARLLRAGARATRAASAEQRDRGIGVVAHAMAERARRRRVRRGLISAAVVAAAVALATLGVRGFLPSVESNAVAACAGDCADEARIIGKAGAASYPPGSHMVAVERPVSVAFGALTRLHLEPRSELVYQQAQGTRRFRLLHGTVRLEVEKLARNQRFIVETASAEVEVRGTRFEVALEKRAGCESVTRVRVSEGKVEVRASGGTRSLSAGQSFESACGAGEELALPPVQEPPAPSGPVPHVTSARRSRALSTERPQASPAPSSEHDREVSSTSNLSLQNDLYARAIAARNAGNTALALDLYGEILSRFPRSALAESAMIERVRLFAKNDRERAAQEARRYLSHFPRGFARHEAGALAEP